MAKRKSTYDPDAQKVYRKKAIAEGREEFLVKLDGPDADALRAAMKRFKLKTRQQAVRFALKKLDEGRNTK